jgi:L-ribulose-5-phosphate 3-epimerase
MFVANPLSHRIGYAHQPQLPLDRVAALGIKHVEIVLTLEQTVAEIQDLLGPHGLQAMTTHIPVGLADESLLDDVAKYSDMAAELGARGHFVSFHAGDMPLEEAYARIRQVGDIAEARGLFVAMETHEDLSENADKAVRVFTAVGHPAVGWNLDTANIYYYNENVDVVEEAKKAAPFIRAIHAKDTTGGYKDPTFPNVGEGIVDYAAVHAVLQTVNFSGPYTLELEGVAGAADSVEAMEANVAACAAHLRKLGVVE